VREELASPNQFNHCIVAIKVSDETQVATVITHPKLGRLLIFDATDDDTPVGDLPDQEQGSLALIVAGDAGSLVRMPVTPAETNLLDRRIQANLAADGSLSAMIQEKTRGNLSSEEGAVLRNTLASLQLAYVEVARGVQHFAERVAEPGGKRGRHAATVAHLAHRPVADVGDEKIGAGAIVSTLGSASLSP